MEFSHLHNVCACLERHPTNAEFHHVFTFLESSSIAFAIKKRVRVYEQLVKSFWDSAKLHDEDNIEGISATVSGHHIVITQAMIRDSLCLNDADGAIIYSESRIRHCFQSIGYDDAPIHQQYKKGLLSSQWRYIAHIILKCMSSKQATFSELSQQQASAMVGLIYKKKFSFSNMIFQNLRVNVQAVGVYKVLLYPRFLQIIFNVYIPGLPREGDILKFSHMNLKVFSFMKNRAGQRIVELFPHMVDDVEEIAMPESSHSGSESSSEQHIDGDSDGDEQSSEQHIDGDEQFSEQHIDDADGGHGDFDVDEDVLNVAAILKSSDKAVSSKAKEFEENDVQLETVFVNEPRIEETIEEDMPRNDDAVRRYAKVELIVYIRKRKAAANDDTAGESSKKLKSGQQTVLEVDQDAVVNQDIEDNAPLKTARLIIRIGAKVEVSFEEHVFCGVWFPATIVEDLGNNLFVVEYRCIGIDDQAEIRKVTVDHLHIRPSAPQFRSTSFGLLEKVDAFYDFGWWSGVITKKLADNRYVVYFKHTNKVKELSHSELRPHVEWKDDKWLTPYQVPVFDDFDNADDDVANGDSGSVNCSTEVTETISLNLTNPIEDTIPDINKQTSIETTSMKRAKTTSLGSNTKSSKSSKKTKAVGTSDDPSLANVGQSKEVDKSAVDKTVVQTPIERGKSVKLEQPKVISARKKGKLSADKTAPESIPKGANMTPDIVEGDRASRIWPIPVVMGLQCIAMSASKKPKTTQSFAPLSPKTTGTGGQDQQFVPLSPKRTGNMVQDQQFAPLSPKRTGNMVQDQQSVPLLPKRTGNMDNDEGDGTVPKRKRGRPFKTEANSHKTSLAENHSNGKIIPDEANVMGYVSRKMRSPPSTVEVNVEKVPNKISGIELSLQQENSKTVKGKRGKPGTLGSVYMESPPQDSQEPSTQISNKIIETSVEKSLDSVLDDQPLAKWFVGKHSSAAPDSTGKKLSENSKDPPAMANGDAPKLTFEKRSQLWGTIEAMEVFRLFPQNPHFRPLDNFKETARERQAINLMVNFSGVFEDMSRLRFDHPRTEIGDHLDTLNELESHGFDVHRIRKRLNALLSLKDKHEKLATNSKEFKGKIETGSAEVKKHDQEIELINTQVKKLKEKRDQITKSEEEKDSELESLKVELEEIKKGMALARCTFEGLAATSL